MIEDETLERTREWQHNPITLRLRHLLHAKLIETQQQYAAANSIDQYRYLSGKEVGYEMAMEAIDQLHEPFSIKMVEVPILITMEKK